MKATPTIIAIALLLLAGCSQTPTGEAVKQEEITIGAPLPLTGSLASIGEDMRDALKLSLRDLNARQDEYHFRIIYDDTGSDTTRAVTAVSSMIYNHGSKLLVGPVASGAVLATAPITEKEHAIIMSVSSAAPISDAGDYVFRNRETGITHGTFIGAYLYRQEYRTMAIIASTSPNAQSYAQSAQDSFIVQGGEVMARSDYSIDTSDFKTALVKAREADVIYIATETGEDAGLIVKQAHELGIDRPLYGAATLGLEEYPTVAKETVEGTRYTYPLSPEESAFTQEYREQYGKEASNFAALAYDNLQLLGDAVLFCNGDDTECIKDYLYGVRDYQGVSGTTSFDEKGDATKPIGVYEYRDGKKVRIA